MKKARALRIIARLKAAEGERSDWEDGFLDSVEARIGTYGRAFADPEKGARESAVSARQGMKLKEIGAKLAGDAKPIRPSKPRTGLTRRTPLGGGRLRPRPDAEEEP